MSNLFSTLTKEISRVFKMGDRNLFSKKSVLILVIIFSFGLLAIALDQHVEGYSSTCPICQAKYLFNDGESSAAVDFYIIRANLTSSDPSVNIPAPFLSPFSNKSPPKYL